MTTDWREQVEQELRVALDQLPELGETAESRGSRALYWLIWAAIDYASGKSKHEVNEDLKFYARSRRFTSPEPKTSLMKRGLRKEEV